VQFRKESQTIPKNLCFSLHCKKRVNTDLSIRLSLLDKVVSIVQIYFFGLCVVVYIHGESQEIKYLP